MAGHLLESAKLYQPVAHHVGIRRQSAYGPVQHITYNLLVVFLLQIYNLKV